jgi:hypothetical protein
MFCAHAELSTQENWPVFMYAGEDAPPLVGQAPIKEHNAWAALYFVVVIVVTSFFYAKLFVGSIVNAYRSHFLRTTGTGVDPHLPLSPHAALTPAAGASSTVTTPAMSSRTPSAHSHSATADPTQCQIQFVRVYRNIVAPHCRPAFSTDEPVPVSSGESSACELAFVAFRKGCFRVYKHAAFQRFIVYVLVFNGVVLGLTYYEQVSCCPSYAGFAIDFKCSFGLCRVTYTATLSKRWVTSVRGCTSSKPHSSCSLWVQSRTLITRGVSQSSSSHSVG